MAGVKNNPIKYRYPFYLFFSPITVVETFDYHSSCQPKTTRRAQTSMKVFLQWGFLSFLELYHHLCPIFFVPYALIYVLHNYLELWWWNSLGFLFSPKKKQTNKTKTNTKPPKKSLCPIYHSLLTSCVVLIDHISLHIN